MALQWTPSNVTSKRLQRVTQWMSCVCVVRGSAFSSSQDSRSGFSTSPSTKKSHVARSVVRDRSGVQHRPLLGQVLAGRKAGGVVAGVDDLSFRSAPEHDSYTSPHARHCGTGWKEAKGIRGRGRARRGLVSPADAVQRRRGARAGRVVRCASPNGEGAHRRPDDRLSPRSGRLPAADRARSRRPPSRHAHAGSLRCEGHGRARRARVRSGRRP